jgi:hypothetical protein
MTAEQVELPAIRFAPLVAPAVDRVFVAGMAAGRTRGGAQLSQRYGGPSAIGYLVEFRTRLAAPDGVVSAAGFAAVTRYHDPGECQLVLDTQISHGTIARDPDGAIRATEVGHEFLRELYELHAQVTAELWAAGHADRVDRLVRLVGRLLAAVPATDGAYAAMAPPYEPLGTPPGVQLLNRLGTLRYHRSDAHAAAWIAAGYTPESIFALRSGPARVDVEAETDRLAAAPYTVLTAEERLALLADLAALPA